MIEKQDSQGGLDVVQAPIGSENEMAEEFWLSDAQCSRLRPMLQNKPRGVPRVDDQRVISGIVHVLQSGCRWKDAPAI